MSGSFGGGVTLPDYNIVFDRETMAVALVVPSRRRRVAVERRQRDVSLRLLTWKFADLVSLAGILKSPEVKGNNFVIYYNFHCRTAGGERSVTFATNSMLRLEKFNFLSKCHPHDFLISFGGSERDWNELTRKHSWIIDFVRPFGRRKVNTLAATRNFETIKFNALS